MIPFACSLPASAQGTGAAGVEMAVLDPSAAGCCWRWRGGLPALPSEIMPAGERTGAEGSRAAGEEARGGWRQDALRSERRPGIPRCSAPNRAADFWGESPSHPGEIKRLSICVPFRGTRMLRKI